MGFSHMTLNMFWFGHASMGKIGCWNDCWQPHKDKKGVGKEKHFFALSARVIFIYQRIHSPPSHPILSLNIHTCWLSQAFASCMWLEHSFREGNQMRDLRHPIFPLHTRTSKTLIFFSSLSVIDTKYLSLPSTHPQILFMHLVPHVAENSFKKGNQMR